MTELVHAGQLDPIAFFNEHGQPRPMKDIPEHARRAIAGIEIDPYKFVVKLIDKREALMEYTKLAAAPPVSYAHLCSSPATD